MAKSKIPIAAVAVLMLPPFGSMALAEDAATPAAPATTAAPAAPATPPAPATPSAAPSVGETLPSVEATAPDQARAPHKPKPRVAGAKRRGTTVASQQGATPTTTAEQSEADAVAGKNDKFDQARGSIFPSIGATSTATATNLQAAVTQGLGTLANTQLVAASAVQLQHALLAD